MESAALADTFRIMTYNVHRCVGTDGKLSPQRIAEVIGACDPDIVALQELDVGRVRTGSVDQTAEIARALGMRSHFHPALQVFDEQYGNAILTRSSATLVEARLLPGPASSRRREPRGAIWVATEIAGCQINIINTHLGLTRSERSMQVGALIGPDWIGGRSDTRALILAGDFNVGRRSRTYRRLAACLHPTRDGLPNRQLRTFPSRLPVLALDHIFAGDAITISALRTIRTPLTRLASDHLPLIADFRILRDDDAGREQTA
jgi:endonuclease/exonuclease/phosphatase family metal-dependent hydrolase